MEDQDRKVWALITNGKEKEENKNKNGGLLGWLQREGNMVRP